MVRLGEEWERRAKGGVLEGASARAKAEASSLRVLGKREHGKSRWTTTKKLTYFLDSFLGFSIVPIRMISLIGLIVSMVSFGYGLLVFVTSLLPCGIST